MIGTKSTRLECYDIIKMIMMYLTKITQLIKFTNHKLKHCCDTRDVQATAFTSLLLIYDILNPSRSDEAIMVIARRRFHLTGC